MGAGGGGDGGETNGTHLEETAGRISLFGLFTLQAIRAWLHAFIWRGVGVGGGGYTHDIGHHSSAGKQQQQRDQ
jgi:hypothetical protein